MVDFAAGTFRINEVQHQDDWTTGPGGQIQPHAETFEQSADAVGPTVYLNLGPTTMAGWAKEPIPRNRSGLGLGSAAGFSGALSWLGAPYTVRSVRVLGAARLAGEATTRYLVRSQLQVDCPKGTSRPRPRPPMQSTTVWIDGQGRLVQARNSVYSSGKIPAAMVRAHPILANRPMGPATAAQHPALVGVRRGRARGATRGDGEPALGLRGGAAPLVRSLGACGRSAEWRSAATQMPVCSARTGSGSGTWGMRALGGMVPSRPASKSSSACPISALVFMTKGP